MLVNLSTKRPASYGRCRKNVDKIAFLDGSKDKPLSEVQQRRNHRIARTPARIEHVFASLAQMGGKTLRSIGLARARLHLNWKVAAYNLQRLVYLKEAGVEAF